MTKVKKVKDKGEVLVVESPVLETGKLLESTITTALNAPADAPGVPGVPVKTEGSRPHPDWVRGRCPECGDDLVSNLYYTGGKGYLLVWECWNSLQEDARCKYRKVL